MSILRTSESKPTGWSPRAVTEIPQSIEVIRRLQTSHSNGAQSVGLNAASASQGPAAREPSTTPRVRPWPRSGWWRRCGIPCSGLGTVPDGLQVRRPALRQTGKVCYVAGILRS